jgi:SAM-dependent methyltransferase
LTGLVVLALGAAAMAVLLFSIGTLSFTGVPVRASPPEAIRAALDLLELRDGERFVDLGCGFGDALRGARRRADVQAVGYELNPFAAAGAALRTDRRTRVRLADFRRRDLTGFDAAFFYLMPRFLQKNAGWLETAFAPGTRVVAIDFPGRDGGRRPSGRSGPCASPSTCTSSAGTGRPDRTGLRGGPRAMPRPRRGIRAPGPPRGAAPRDGAGARYAAGRAGAGRARSRRFAPRPANGSLPPLAAPLPERRPERRRANLHICSRDRCSVPDRSTRFGLRPSWTPRPPVMKKDQVPQDASPFDLFALGFYAVDEKGNFDIVSSVGWQATNEGWGDRLKIERDGYQQVRERVERGEMSPLYYHMTVRRFTPGLLASYVGLWGFQVKRHLKPKVWAKLSPGIYERYARLFQITVEELKTLPPPNAPLPLEKKASPAK